MILVGNSCRSPMAESILRDMINKCDKSLDWVVDSAGIANWNVGRSPEPRCLFVLHENGLTSNHIGRQVNTNLSVSGRIFP